MKQNRKRVAVGLAAAGLAAGALAVGGVALAATGAAPAPATSTSARPSHGFGAGHFGGMYGMHGMWSGQQPVMAAAATYLGLSQTQLRTQLQAGKSLADVAKVQGKPVPGLKDAILAGMTSRINADSTLTAEQKAAMISHMKSHLDAIVDVDMDMSHSLGAGMGQMGSPGQMGMWR
jgi:hypothetical protein